MAQVQHENYFEWAMHLTRGQLLDRVLDIEDRLRTLVRQVLRQAKPDWLALVPANIRESLSAKPGQAGEVDILDRADLGQLAGIALSRWRYFAEFLGDKPAFQVKMDEFRTWRNFLAHGKHPTDAEKLEIVVTIRQVGEKIPALSLPQPIAGQATLAGARVVWADDHPEWNRRERRILEMLGIEVVPALENEEALSLATDSRCDLMVSDIERGSSESGLLLPSRLAHAGLSIPVFFYVGAVDLSRGIPAGGAGITNDPAILIRDILVSLSGAS